jgi:cellulose biosynthesis protein BcsQ
MSTIHFIGGEKGGVGKSVVARIVAQYLIDHQMPFAGVDGDRSNPTFSRYYSSTRRSPEARTWRDAHRRFTDR